MDLDSDNELLTIVAGGGSVDYSSWPALLPRLTKRIEEIVHNEFPIPILTQRPPIRAQSLQPSSDLFQTQPDDALLSTSSQSTDKENAPPPQAATSFGSNIDTEPVETPAGTLPPQILTLVASIIQTLEAYFSKYPPHTIQRLSELVLTPRRHYRTLPAYLHAVDRVVHVTSGANIYPLPAAVPDDAGAKILSNGASTIAAGGADPNSVSWGTSTITSNLGSDESLGGALLTPIPWLRHGPAMPKNGSRQQSELEGEIKTETKETIDGPNGPGGIETVSVSVNGIPSATLASSPVLTSSETTIGGLRAEGGVTQGELLRQEQRAGVVPASQVANNRGSIAGDGEEDDAPHARGPDEIGMEDIGGQVVGSRVGMHGMQGIDVEAAVGRRAESHDASKEEVMKDIKDETSTTPKRELDDGDASEPETKRVKEETEVNNKYEDSEMETVDADGKTEDETKFGEKGEERGADAIDTSAV